MERAAVFLVKNYLVGYHAPFLIESDGVAILHVLLMAILNYEKMFFWYIEDMPYYIFIVNCYTVLNHGWKIRGIRGLLYPSLFGIDKINIHNGNLFPRPST